MELLAIIIVIFIVLGAEVLIYKKYALKGINYTVKVNKTEVYEGEYIELIETVENLKHIPLPWIKTELSTSKWLVFLKKNSPVQTIGDENTFIPGVFSLKPRSRCIRTRKIKCLKRGVFTFDNTVLHATDILGLVHFSYSIPLNISVTVLPIASDNSDAILSFTEPIGEIPVKRFINEDPFIISGSKEYTGREPLNRINWNYTAVWNKPAVYNNEYSTTRSVLILINMQRKDIYPVTCADMRDIEAFIKLTVKLCQDCINNGCSCAFVANGGKEGLSGIESGVIINNEHFEHSLRILAKLENVCVTEFNSFCEKININGFTDIIFISHYIDENMISFSDYLKSNHINSVFYISSEIPDFINEYDNQILNVSRFSYRWNYIANQGGAALEE